ncbi:hypothetical protein [Vibrio gallaecicus]|nr:hypothetical protein [Vibrio gallaecicus]MDN3613616.1 hypothetical protein [Vibrio gallaecicus]MDN3614927.1 hypothetical protein [Vibrio gallaecicus]
MSGVLYIILMLFQNLHPKGVHCHSVAANILLTVVSLQCPLLHA